MTAVQALLSRGARQSTDITALLARRDDTVVQRVKIGYRNVGRHLVGHGRSQNGVGLRHHLPIEPLAISRRQIVGEHVPRDGRGMRTYGCPWRHTRPIRREIFGTRSQ